MRFPRTVAPETLDELAPSDPRARRSRRDLRRVNRFMGTRGLMIRGMQPAVGQRSRARPLRVLELGAGDGCVMLDVARTMSRSWPAVQLTLLDRQPLIDTATCDDFARFGWTAQALVVDVRDWAVSSTVPLSSRWDLIVTNLFLHHFDERQLPTLLSAIAARCDAFVACEPRRTVLPLVGSHLMGAIGASPVTRHDAALSVHAGFRDLELSTVWPTDRGDWYLQEHRAGLFSHFFRAARCGITAAETA